MTDRNRTDARVLGPHRYDRREVAADAVLHIVGLVFAVAAAVALMLVTADRGADVVAACAVFAGCMLISFAASAAYHMIAPERWRNLLRKFDHSAIFLMIAGSYTPIAALVIGGGEGEILLSVMWALAATGVLMTLFRRSTGLLLTAGLCLGMGWAGLAAIDTLIERLTPAALILLLIAGLVYTLGIAALAAQRMRYHNALWHGCVLAGGALVYSAILVEMV